MMEHIDTKFGRVCITRGAVGPHFVSLQQGEIEMVIGVYDDVSTAQGAMLDFARLLDEGLTADPEAKKPEPVSNVVQFDPTRKRADAK